MNQQFTYPTKDHYLRFLDKGNGVTCYKTFEVVDNQGNLVKRFNTPPIDSSNKRLVLSISGSGDEENFVIDTAVVSELTEMQVNGQNSEAFKFGTNTVPERKKGELKWSSVTIFCYLSQTPFYFRHSENGWHGFISHACFKVERTTS